MQGSRATQWPALRLSAHLQAHHGPFGTPLCFLLRLCVRNSFSKLWRLSDVHPPYNGLLSTIHTIYCVRPPRPHSSFLSVSTDGTSVAFFHDILVTGYTWCEWRRCKGTDRLRFMNSPLHVSDPDSWRSLEKEGGVMRVSRQVACVCLTNMH
jgi:hypothetical protein